MNEITVILTILTVHIIALMSPGPDFALVVQNAGRYGRQTGFMIALGLSLGILLHSILSLTGASLLIQQQPTLFAILQASGGGYLLWLGFGALQALYRHLKHNTTETNAPTTSNKLISNKRQALAKGFTTSILNPKALIFFLSLLSTLVPVGMSLSGKALTVSLLWFTALLWFAVLAWLLTGVRLQQKLKQWAPYIDGICGFLFIIIGSGIWLNLIRHSLS